MKALWCIVDDRWNLKNNTQIFWNVLISSRGKWTKINSITFRYYFKRIFQNNPSQIIWAGYKQAKKKCKSRENIPFFLPCQRSSLIWCKCQKKHVVYWVAMQKWIFLWKTASVAQVYNRTRQGREIWIIFRGLGFLAVVWFGSSPTLSPVSKLSLSFSVSFCVAGGAKLYDDKKAWNSINYSILSATRILR